MKKGSGVRIQGSGEGFFFVPACEGGERKGASGDVSPLTPES